MLSMQFLQNKMNYFIFSKCKQNEIALKKKINNPQSFNISFIPNTRYIV